MLAHDSTARAIENPNRILRWVAMLGHLSLSGKSAAIYACAREQGFQVIEDYPFDGRGCKSLVTVDCLFDDIGVRVQPSTVPRIKSII
ncbi:hypothetical protein FRX31_006083 [Thalictrum thalictroides]|uniref:Uncharacterized protein n=1 Tax=Thalictrum thalictroides TaxID=46969 RepID=A0A7J6X6Y3_THATH|nr:hypothetical protein FRX31_006083 [Thalictrum thalictroides]